MVVHKDVAKTHEEGNAHDATIMAIPIKEKAKGATMLHPCFPGIVVAEVVVGGVQGLTK
jgi:hypothetical protein